jgi:starvation-inducible DNA-binding protein
MSTNTGINEADRIAIVEELKKIQADEFTLYIKTWGFHWNVTGMNFNDLHLFFLGHYQELQVFVDDVAERIRKLGHVAPSTIIELKKNARLGEMVGETHTAEAMIDILLEDHETLIESLRKTLDLTVKHNDMGTNNFLTDLLEKHEKMAWMLRAYLNK